MSPKTKTARQNEQPKPLLLRTTQATTNRQPSVARPRRRRPPAPSRRVVLVWRHVHGHASHAHAECLTSTPTSPTDIVATRGPPMTPCARSRRAVLVRLHVHGHAGHAHTECPTPTPSVPRPRRRRPPTCTHSMHTARTAVVLMHKAGTTVVLTFPTAAPATAAATAVATTGPWRRLGARDKAGQGGARPLASPRSAGQGGTRRRAAPGAA